jgi:S-adenosylmethionine:tRNA ribosyltransferase-isomerase
LEKAYKNIKIEDFNYPLDESRIAKYPEGSRDESKLLSYDGLNINTFQFKQLPELLQENDLLVFNNAKVIQARLDFCKATGAQIEIFCLEPHLPADYNLAFQVHEECQWKCLVGNLKKWKSGVLVKHIHINDIEYTIEARHIDGTTNAEIIQFKWYRTDIKIDNEHISFGDILESVGSTPLPPYLNREAESSDKIRYQTVYARQKGSVAAPTAGLHFTEEVFDAMATKGISKEYITLHVGAGTFRPVKSPTIDGHEMHEEHFEISRETLEHLLEHEGRIISVGTTSARTLESIHRIGAKLIRNEDKPFQVSQWEVYEKPFQMNFKESMQAIIEYMDKNQVQQLKASTSIIIVPGYQFKTIKGLITNFHQPQSTLLLLIAAAIGEAWHQVYDYALQNDYRFLSYGDSSFLVF